MKKFAILGFVLALCGCAHNEFDVSPDQVKKAMSGGPSGGVGSQKMPDLDHLPPGAVKHVQTFKKGDVLPDGSISHGDTKMVTVQIPKGSGATGFPGGTKFQTMETHGTEGK
jgi:hypothetical protein